jgi:hypothetical protein
MSTQKDGEKKGTNLHDLKRLFNDSSPKELKPRNYPNWILAFREWSSPTIDAPESFIFWSALYTLSSVVKRKLKFPEEITGSWTVSPNLFIMFVAPPGTKKTATLESFSLRLLSKIETVSTSSTFFTKESLMAQLVECPDYALSIVVGEFGELMQKNKPGEMYDFLISLFDASIKDKLEVSTLKRGKETAHTPCITMAAATTPIWMKENMSENAIHGGFSSRVIYVVEDEVRPGGLFLYRKRLKGMNLDRTDMETKLLEDLMQINLLEGEFSMDEDVEDYANEWYENVHKKSVKEADEKLLSYYSRKPGMILKLAMLYSVSKGNDMKITKEDIDFGIHSMETTERNLINIYRTSSKNEHMTDIERIIAYVKKHEKVSYTELCREFANVGDALTITTLIKTGIAQGKIKQNGTVYDKIAEEHIPIFVPINSKI